MAKNKYSIDELFKEGLSNPELMHPSATDWADMSKVLREHGAIKNAGILKFFGYKFDLLVLAVLGGITAILYDFPGTVTTPDATSAQHTSPHHSTTPLINKLQTIPDETFVLAENTMTHGTAQNASKKQPFPFSENDLPEDLASSDGPEQPSGPQASLSVSRDAVHQRIDQEKNAAKSLPHTKHLPTPLPLATDKMQTRSRDRNTDAVKVHVSENSGSGSRSSQSKIQVGSETGALQHADAIKQHPDDYNKHGRSNALKAPYKKSYTDAQYRRSDLPIELEIKTMQTISKMNPEVSPLKETLPDFQMPAIPIAKDENGLRHYRFSLSSFFSFDHSDYILNELELLRSTVGSYHISTDSGNQKRYTVGLRLAYEFSPGLSIQFGLMYSRKGRMTGSVFLQDRGGDFAGVATYSFSGKYYEVPLLLKFTNKTRLFDWYITGGMKFQINVASDDNYFEYTDYTEGQVYHVELGGQSVGNALHLATGMEYEISPRFRWFAEPSFSYSLSPVVKLNNFTKPPFNPNINTFGIGAGLIYMF